MTAHIIYESRLSPNAPSIQTDHNNNNNNNTNNSNNNNKRPTKNNLYGLKLEYQQISKKIIICNTGIFPNIQPGYTLLSVNGISTSGLSLDQVYHLLRVEITLCHGNSDNDNSHGSGSGSDNDNDNGNDHLFHDDMIRDNNNNNNKNSNNKNGEIKKSGGGDNSSSSRPHSTKKDIVLLTRFDNTIIGSSTGTGTGTGTGGASSTSRSKNQQKRKPPTSVGTCCCDNACDCVDSGCFCVIS